MSFRLESYEPLPEGIQRIALEQIDQALVQLRDQPDGYDEAIHDARKRFKKVRAVLRLVRDEIGEEVYHRENICLRDAGRRLAVVRDSVVMLETLEYVAAHAPGQLEPALVHHIEQRLVYAHDYLIDRVLGDGSVLALVIDMLTQARARVRTWPLVHDDFSALAGGSRRVYKRGRKRLADAYATGSSETFHEWRKRTKYLWYHVRILKPLWPVVLDELADEIHELANWLGQAHDLSVFLAKIDELPELSEDGNARVFEGLMTRQRAALRSAAYPLGERIYAEKPNAFVKRLAGYWAAWQRGIEMPHDV